MITYKSFSKADNQLDLVDNTRDIDKPISTAQNAVISSLTNVNSLMQGLTWDSVTDVYQRIGSLAGEALSISPGNAKLPIQSQMKRVMLKDDGTENYEMDDIYPLNKIGMTVQYSGTCTQTSSGSIVAAAAWYVVAYLGCCVKNTTTNKIYLITGGAETIINVNLNGYFSAGDTFEIYTAKLDGSDGNMMVKIPKFYEYHNLAGTLHTWAISLYKLPGFELHPAFIKDGVEVENIYIGAFEGSMFDLSTGAMATDAVAIGNSYAAGDKLCSLPFQCPKVNETRAEYRTMAAARGTGFRQLTYYKHSAIQLLYLIEYANFNSQTCIGAGRTNLSGGTWVADSYIGRTGMSLGDGNTTNNVSLNGTAGYLTDYMTYRGIENFYGNVWIMIDGIAWDGRWTGAAVAQPVYLTNNSNYFQDQLPDNQSALIAPYIGASGGYISDIQDMVGFLPKAAVGSSTTKLCDYYYQNSEASRDFWRVVLVGGSSVDGFLVGSFCVNSIATWSYSNWTTCGRLCF